METDLLLDFPVELFARRRCRVLDLLGDDALVLPAACLLVRGGDSELPYRPDSDLFYLTGFREPDAVLVLRGHADQDRAVLFLRPRNPGMEVWTGPRLGPDRAGELLGIEDTRSVETLSGELPRLLHGARRIHFRLEGRGPGRPGVGGAAEAGVLEALRWSRTRGARTGAGPRGLMDPGVLLHELRLRKEPEEVQAIRQAVAASVAGFEAAFSLMRPGVGEWELEAALVAGFRRSGATAPAFAPIVASGRNACVLHYIENQRRVQEGEMVLMDAGAEVRLYAGDITRTVPASGRFSPAQRDLYRVVEAARAAAVEAVAPGVPLDRVHRAAVVRLVEGMIGLGVLEGDVEELVAEEAWRPWYPHQTSHWLGLDTHDPGDYAVAGAPRVLEPGMVLTIEPGLYFPPPGFLGDEPSVADGASGSAGGGEGDHRDGAAPFRGMGIRIEDDVLVTPEGREVLTGALPTDPDEVEARIGG
jgi:Xaa-Pro aminopeptidase